jgi:hypothetical protein
MRWWDLPGPYHFLLAAAQSLREGRSVVLAFPHTRLPFFRSLIRDMSGDSFQWTPLPSNLVSDGDLTSEIFDHLIHDLEPSTLRTIPGLLNQTSFLGRLCWVDECTIENWKHWREFILEYAHASGAVTPGHRSVFCLVTSGIERADLPAEHPNLAVFTWFDVVDSLDIEFFVAATLRSSSLSPLSRRLLISRIAHLALWDHELAQFMVDRPQNTLLEPRSVLEEWFQQCYGANYAPLSANVVWEHGLLNKFDGIERNHSVTLLKEDHHNELDRRIWLSEMTTVLPIVEQWRLIAIQKAEGDLKLPVETDNGTISNIHALEIGPLVYHIKKQKIQIDTALWSILCQLPEIRNRLAHLTPLSRSQLEVLLKVDYSVMNLDDLA